MVEKGKWEWERNDNYRVISWECKEDDWIVFTPRGVPLYEGKDFRKFVSADEAKIQVDLEYPMDATAP